MIIPLTESTDNLSDALYETVLEDDVAGDFFFDALDEIDCSLDTFVDVGDYTFLVQDPSTPFLTPDQGNADVHGERIYCHVSGASIKVYVSKSEDDGLLPSDHAFWTSYFSNENLSRHIYQGMVDLGAQYNINNIDLNEAMSPIQPRVQTPSKIDHAAM